MSISRKILLMGLCVAMSHVVTADTVETRDEHFVFFISQLRALIETGIEPLPDRSLSDIEAAQLTAISAMTARLRVEQEQIRSENMCSLYQAEIRQGATPSAAANSAVAYFEARDTRATEFVRIIPQIEADVEHQLGIDMLDTIHDIVAQRQADGSGGRMGTARGFFVDDEAFIASRCEHTVSP